MKVMQMSCPSCLAPLKIPEDIDRLNCAFCGSELVVKRSKDIASLKLAEHITRKIQDVGEETQNIIRKESHATQAELKRIQTKQEISSLTLQLANVQSEMRALERGKKNRKVKSHLKELSHEEDDLLTQIEDLESELGVIPTDHGRRTVGKAILIGVGAWFAVIVACALLYRLVPSQLLDQNSFGQAVSGFLATALMAFSLLVGISSSAYYLTPEARIWQILKNRLTKIRSSEQTTEASGVPSPKE